MERTRKVLAIGVLSGFVLLALLPFLGIHPATIAANMLSNLNGDNQEYVYDVASDSGSETAEMEDTQFSGIESSDSEIAKAAVYALSNSLSDETISVLFPVLEKEVSIEVKKAALYAIANHETSEVTAFLADVARTSTNTELAKAAVYAIGNHHSEEARRALLDLLNSEQ